MGKSYRYNPREDNDYDNSFRKKRKEKINTQTFRQSVRQTEDPEYRDEEDDVKKR